MRESNTTNPSVGHLKTQGNAFDTFTLRANGEMDWSDAASTSGLAGNFAEYVYVAGHGWMNFNGLFVNNADQSITLAGPVFTGTASNTDRAGELTMSNGTVTLAFTDTYNSHPIFTANDITAVSSVQPVYSGTTSVTFHGTGADVVYYVCMDRN